MFFQNMRLALAASYVFLVVARLWRNTPEEWWALIGLFALANLVLSFIEGVWGAWEVRRVVRRLRSLDPVRSARILRNVFWRPARRLLRERLEAEGRMESDGVVEQFPFSTQDRRENTLFFWLSVAGAVIMVGAQFTPVAATPARRSALWIGVVALIVCMAWLRRVERRLATVITVSQFGIMEVHPDGIRRSLNWTGGLVLRLNRRRARLELAPTGGKDFVPLDFGRLGFERLVDRVLDYGGFRAALAEREAQQTAPETRAQPERGVRPSLRARFRLQLQLVPRSTIARAAEKSRPSCDRGDAHLLGESSAHET